MNRLFIGRLFLILFIVFAALSLNIIYSQSHPRNVVSRGILIDISPPWDTIDSGVAECVVEGINEAERNNALLIYRVNSYGGLLDAAFAIGDSIYYSNIPTVAYVENKALSAGTLIILPADFIAVQRGSIVGAMKPVLINPATGEITFVNESKIIEPVIGKAEIYGGAKSRNTSLIREFILEAKVINSTTAVSFGLADVEVNDLNELISRLNGVTIEKGGTTYKLEVSPGSIEVYTCSVRSRTLSILSNAYLSNILLSIGILVAIFSLVTGRIVTLPLAIALMLLGLISTGMNPNLISAFFILLGAVLLAVELFVIPGFGIVGISGIVLITLGFTLLPMYVPAGVAPREDYINALRIFIFGTAVVLGGFFGIVIFKVIEVKRKKPIRFTPEGREGIAVDDLKPGLIGYVRIEGEYWRATSKGEIKAGDRVVVIEMREDGVLVVDRK
ncbi:MAG: NfeD family protein [Desulfurococcaceae archaeon]